MSQVISPSYLRRRDRYAMTLRRAVYIKPLATGGATDTEPMKAFAVEAYGLRTETVQTPRGRTAGGLILKTGYIVRGKTYAGADLLLQVVTWHVDLLTRPIRARTPLGPPVVVRVGTATGHLVDLITRA